jgi:hypothetical protein
VGVLESDSGLNHITASLSNRESPPRRKQKVDERPPVDVLQNEEVRAVLARNIVGPNDVRVVESGNGSGLPIEPFDPDLVSREFERQYLDGDAAM